MTEERKLFSEIALVGPALFFGAAFSEDELAARFAKMAPDTARDFLVLKTLTEVQKYGVAARRWESQKEKQNSDDSFDMLVLESFQVERVAWQRRLLEALVTLINFSTTNQNEYFAHFLAVQEYEREQHRASDECDFFGAKSELTKQRLSIFQCRVDEAHARLPILSACWYLKTGNLYKTATLRSQYLRALKLARPAEKTALGYTYQLSFSAASERLHFGVLDPPNKLKSDDREIDAFCGLLAIAILCRAHELCGVSPRGINRTLMQPENRDRPVSTLLASRVEVGDFVLIAGPHLAEVREIRKGQFGYESYRLEFLDTDAGPGLNEDWQPAPAVGIFMRRQELLGNLRTRLAEDTSGGLVFTNEDLHDATRKTVIEMWQIGLRAYFSRQMDNVGDT